MKFASEVEIDDEREFLLELWSSTFSAGRFLFVSSTKGFWVGMGFS
jgi:hypothetical protein